MHNSMCCWKLACLLCNYQSDYHKRTSKTINVSFNKWGRWQWGHWNGATGVHQSIFNGYGGESIEHSLKRTEIPNFKGNSHTELQYETRKGNSHTCQ